MTAEQSIVQNVGDILTKQSHSPLSLNFVYLKYLFIFVLIFSFLFMMLGKSNKPHRLSSSSRRNFKLLWNDDKHEKMKGLLKKSTNISNFEKYKPSDIENITLLNTLINAYISKIYDELSCLKGPNNLTSDILNKSGEQKDKIELDKLSSLETPSYRSSILVKHISADSHQVECTSSRTESDSNPASNEVEQGSHIDCDYQANALSEAPKMKRSRSILKTKKNVCFNMALNQEFKISRVAF